MTNTSREITIQGTKFNVEANQGSGNNVEIHLRGTGPTTNLGNFGERIGTWINTMSSQHKGLSGSYKQNGNEWVITMQGATLDQVNNYLGNLEQYFSTGGGAAGAAASQR